MVETPALDRQEALNVCGGDEDMFLNFLSVYDEGSLNPHALRLHKGIMKKDFEEIRLGGYFLKCGAGYICAKRIYDLSVEFQRKGTLQESMDSILKDYMEFLNEARKVKKEIAQILKRPISLDTADFERFEQQVRKAYPENFPVPKVSPLCHGCNIF